MTTLGQRLEKGIRNPRFAARFVLNQLRAFFRKRYTWTDHAHRNLRKKVYQTYDEYLVHQKAKLGLIEDELHAEYDQAFRDALTERLGGQNIVQPGMTVLCLAARIGTEVKSFLDLGCFAIGLDLNPGRNNKHVVYGDFHAIQFPDHSVDVIFSNSLDHAFDLKQLITEIKRVLKPNGFLIVEIVRGTDEGYVPKHYEVSIWKTINDVLDVFRAAGFRVIKTTDFDQPWEGQHVSLALEAAPRRRAREG